MTEQIYLSNDRGQKYLYHKVKDTDLDKIESLLPEGNPNISDIVLHWSAGTYTTMFQHYQINVTLDSVAIADKSKIFSWREFAHTFRRNTGRIGVSFCAMFDIKKYPVTDNQIEMMIKTLTIICRKYNLNPLEDIKSHGEFAKIDGYAHLRWDTDLVKDWGMGKETLTNFIRKRVASNLKSVNVKTNVQKREFDKDVVSFFEDVKPENWCAKAVVNLSKVGIMNGDSSSGKPMFYPEKNITRKEIMAIFSKIIFYTEQKKNKRFAIENKNVEYTDVKTDDWFYKCVQELTNRGIVSGYSEQDKLLFKPDQELTRAEFCSLVFNLSSYLELVLQDEQPIKSFIDLKNNYWAIKQINWCVVKGIIVEYKTTKGSYFKPEDKMKRSDVAVCIYKFIKGLL